VIVVDICVIRANAVVNKNFNEKEILITGIPAKKSDKGNHYIRN